MTRHVQLQTGGVSHKIDPLKTSFFFFTLGMELIYSKLLDDRSNNNNIYICIYIYMYTTFVSHWTQIACNFLFS